MESLFVYIIAILGLAIGLILGYWVRKQWVKNRKDTVEAKIEGLITAAKAKQKEILLAAQDKAIKILEETKNEERQKQQELSEAKKRLEKRESLFDQKLLDLENKKQDLSEKADKINKIKLEIETIREEQLAKLERVAGLTKEEAKKVLMDNAEQGIAENLVHRIHKL
ncbi:DUF3552 domain-containing protein, partial [Candidatus Falkowbacteria bacterium]|nr:DUF3552 domain-containing protein [Candidatus Falkowbacteria bacterium]